MARKAKKSSCQVEHWWEDMPIGNKKGEGKWQQCTNKDFRFIIRHMIEGHELGRPARPEDLLGIKYRTFKRLGLAGMLMIRFPGFCIITALRHAYPEFFDVSRKDHVHEWDINQRGLWSGTKDDTPSRTAVRHMIERHLLGRSAQPIDLLDITADSFIQLGLYGLLQRFQRSPIAALRHAYPEFFDVSRKDHVHEWDFKQQGMWKDEASDALARSATRHLIEGHHLERIASAEDLRGVNQELFKYFGLSGMLSVKFEGSHYQALRHAYPEFAEAIGRRLKGTADFVEVLETEDPVRTRQLLRGLMRHFGDDLVDVAEILAVVYTGRLDSKTAMEILQDPTMRPWIVPFTGKGHGPGKPPIDNDFPFYLLEKDKNGVIAGIIRRRLTEWRRKVLGARPSKEARERFLRELRVMQERLAKGGK